MESCPCCGYRTISERNHYEICWWEDDGQDNENAGAVMGGPNDKFSLAICRYNYLTYGVYNPKRIDLIKVKAVKNNCEKGRVFEIIDNEYLIGDGK